MNQLRKKFCTAATLFVALLSFPLHSLAGTTRATPADSIVSTDGTKTWTLNVAGPVMSSTGVIQEAPSGTINGSNTGFTLSQTPGASSTVLCWLDGQFLIQTTDYTRSGATLTMVTAPATGQVLTCQYSRN